MDDLLRQQSIRGLQVKEIRSTGQAFQGEGEAVLSGGKGFPVGQANHFAPLQVPQDQTYLRCLFERKADGRRTTGRVGIGFEILDIDIHWIRSCLLVRLAFYDSYHMVGATHGGL